MTTAMDHYQLKDKIGKLFELARDQSVHHGLIETAKKLYSKQEDQHRFLKSFLSVLKYALVYPDKVCADRMLIFVSKFASSLYAFKALMQDSDDSEEELEHPFITGLFNYLFETHLASLVDVRLRCTILINYILTSLPDDSWLPVGIWNGLTEITRSRLQDRNANVRVAAVLVARKLQEPKDPKCEIVKLLSFHMTDPSPAVRRAVISSIALSKFTILDVLGRTLDVNENVRRNAFAVIAKVRFQSLSISQRVTLLDRGLKDRAERVRICVESILLSQWLDQVDKDVLKLIEGLDVLNCSETAELALKAIAKLISTEELIVALPIEESTRLVSAEKLTPEIALLWRFLVGSLKETGSDNLEAILPTLTTFTSFIKSWVSADGVDFSEMARDQAQWVEVKRKHILNHLLEMASLYDLSDEMGRLSIRNLALSMLINPQTGSQLIDTLVSIIHKTIPQPQQFIRTILEAISDVREPLVHVAIERSNLDKIKKDLEISGFKVALNDLKEKEYLAAKSKDYNEAAKLSTEIVHLTSKIKELSDQPSEMLSEMREEKKDPVTLCKCLRILIKALAVCGITTLDNDMKRLREGILIPSLQSDDLLSQSLAIQALAQFCILDKELAQDHLLTFLFMLSESGENDVNIPALKAVFDILQIHGTECFNTLEMSYGSQDKTNGTKGGEGNDNSPTAKCIVLLKELLNQSTNDELKKTAFEGFCKLLLTGVIYSPSLLKSIIINGFTPIRGNEAEDKIRQIFMVFFPLFAHNTVGSQEMIEETFIPVIRALKDAKIGSPEADISIRDMVTFLIEYTKPDINKNTSKTVHVHNTLAFSMCHEMLREVAFRSEPIIDHDYLRGLLQLRLSFESEVFSHQMLSLLAKIKRESYDGTSMRFIKQLQEKIMTHCNGAESVQNTFATTQQSMSSEKSILDIRSSGSTCLAPDFASKMSLENIPETNEDLNSSTKTGPIVMEGITMFVPESPDISSE